jgi:hypothetical protein
MSGKGYCPPGSKKDSKGPKMPMKPPPKGAKKGK